MKRLMSVLFALMLIFSMVGGVMLPNATPVKANGGVNYYVSTIGGDIDGDGSSGNPWLTITWAISQSNAGDTINVAAGAYYENITLKDGVEVLGAGADATTIDGGGSGSVVTGDGVGSGTKLDGFTITNGSAEYGGGMYNYESSPTVTNCTFSDNSATYGGGMLNGTNSSPTVTNCTFSGNSATNGGGGGMCNGSSAPTVTNCTYGWGGGNLG